jgi:hypothetical protein
MTSWSVRLQCLSHKQGELKDPYELLPEDIEDPPVTFMAALKRIGPGMILAASIVGSGELIATTTLGAQVGFTALWVILLSCLIKPVLQAEDGAIHHRERRDRVGRIQPVFRVRAWRVNWVVWCWAIMTLLTLLADWGDVWRSLAGHEPVRSGDPGHRLDSGLLGDYARDTPRWRI